MMNFQGINDVMHRIAELNNRFGIQTQSQPQKATVKSKESFAQTMQEAIDNSSVGNSKTQNTTLGQDTDKLIQAAARKYQVDPRLAAAVAQVESGGSQAAVSSAGAIGIMQLMPETASALGVDPYNKQQNIEGGVKYLREMLDSFGGDVQKAVAAYNAGAQPVKEYNGVPPYRETQSYVNKVLDIYR